MVTKTAKAYGGLLSGTSASDILHGLGGIDRIEGGAGDDTIDGGANNDWLYGGAGIDTVTGGAGNDWIGGGDGDDTLSGGAGIDLLYGGAGNDRLDGGAGADVMTGGKGDDVYIVDHALDQVVETSGGGNDTVFSTVSFSLAGILPILDGLFQTENLTLSGTANINGTGNKLANLLTGNDAANRLDGGAGDDILTGASGADSLRGGIGADRFVYLKATDSTLGAFDSILDFNAIDAQKDLIDFSRLARADNHVLNWSNKSPSAFGVWEGTSAGVRTVMVDTTGDRNADMQIALPGLGRDLVLDDFSGVEPPKLGPTPKDIRIVDSTNYKHFFNSAEFGFSPDMEGYTVRIDPLALPVDGTLRYGAEKTLITTATDLTPAQLDTLVYTASPDPTPGNGDRFGFSIFDVTGQPVTAAPLSVSLDMAPGKMVIDRPGFQGEYTVLKQAQMRGIADMPYVAVLDKVDPGAPEGTLKINVGDLLYFGAVPEPEIGSAAPIGLGFQFVTDLKVVQSDGSFREDLIGEDEFLAVAFIKHSSSESLRVIRSSNPTFTLDIHDRLDNYSNQNSDTIQYFGASPSDASILAKSLHDIYQENFFKDNLGSAFTDDGLLDIQSYHPYSI